jgi:hypothetical protein
MPPAAAHAPGGITSSHAAPPHPSSAPPPTTTTMATTSTTDFVVSFEGRDNNARKIAAVFEATARNDPQSIRFEVSGARAVHHGCALQAINAVLFTPHAVLAHNHTRI